MEFIVESSDRPCFSIVFLEYSKSKYYLDYTYLCKLNDLSNPILLFNPHISSRFVESLEYQCFSIVLWICSKSKYCQHKMKFLWNAKQYEFWMKAKSQSFLRRMKVEVVSNDAFLDFPTLWQICFNIKSGKEMIGEPNFFFF